MQIAKINNIISSSMGGSIPIESSIHKSTARIIVIVLMFYNPFTEIPIN